MRNDARPDPRQSRRRFWLVAGSLVFALVAAEVALRIGDPLLRYAMLSYDPVLGWGQEPNDRRFALDENVIWIRINSDGLRDREHDIAKPAGTVRVAVLGDSFMAAHNLPIEKVFTSLLESRLGECAPLRGRRVETINFGVAGYNTAQELLSYRHKARKYQADIVIVAIYTGNDIYGNHRRLREITYPDSSPYFVLDGDRLALDDSFRQFHDVSDEPWWRRYRVALTKRFRTADLLYGGYADLRNAFRADHDDLRHIEMGSEDLYAPPDIPEVVDAWRVTEAILLTLVREVRADGAEPWMVTLSNVEQVHPDLDQRARFRASLGVDSLFYPDRRLRDFAGANGIPIVSLAEPLADYAASARVFLNGGYNKKYPDGTGHWNERGHALAAQLVSEQLCAQSAALNHAR